MPEATQEKKPVTTQRQRYLDVREFTDRIVGPLTAEDCMVQSMDDVSPTRWHIAHTTWFFETFVLKKSEQYTEFDPQFNYLFNSYYNSIGEQFPRPKRGFISRPGLDQIKAYRQYVDENMQRHFESGEFNNDVAKVVEVGLQHEQQHQELMLTDIKHVLSCNPTLPAYSNTSFDRSESGSNDRWTSHSAGNYEIGFQEGGFSFDNESPRHQVYLNEFQLADQLVTNRQYIEFIEDGGYQKPEYWLSMGWSAVNEQRWNAPLYWVKQDHDWFQFTLSGLHPVNLDWPVCHISYFEADAFARWAGYRLPTEYEWEVASADPSRSGAASDLKSEPFADFLFANDLTIHPTRSPTGLLGGLWQWTSSSYGAYPGYRPAPGAIGEYNGKFMCNQYVLRGGSVATTSNHIRETYRNFFPPNSRWQFFGVRLAH